MSGKIGETKDCEDGTCEVRHLLVRGDKVSFITQERVDQTGLHPLDDEKMPSDLVIPAGFVLVHDTTGKMLDRCDLHIVRWRTGGVQRAHNRRTDVDPDALDDARAYFGSDDKLTIGRIDIPKGPWHRVAQVKFIRYRRVGEHGGSYEHEYEIPVDLMYCTKPLAWRLPLPSGCIVDPRGFVWP